MLMHLSQYAMGKINFNEKKPSSFISTFISIRTIMKSTNYRNYKGNNNIFALKKLGLSPDERLKWVLNCTFEISILTCRYYYILHVYLFDFLFTYNVFIYNVFV